MSKNQDDDAGTTPAVFTLWVMLYKSAQVLSDIVLDQISKGQRINPSIVDAVYFECLFLALHQVLRDTFHSSGPATRNSLQDALAPLLFRYYGFTLNTLCESRFGADMSEDFLTTIKDSLESRLNSSELEYAQVLEDDHAAEVEQLVAIFVTKLARNEVELDSEFAKALPMLIFHQESQLQGFAFSAVLNI